MTTKAIVILSALLVWSGPVARAQSADTYVSQGRAYLAVSNILAANTSFSNALVLSPTHPTANALYAATRILTLPYQPVGSNFLSRLGLPAAGRNIYQWTAQFQTNADGVPVVPAGVNLQEAVFMLRTNILPAIYNAEVNLSQIKDTTFTLNLTAAETRTVAVTLDYGDIQMLRAVLRGAQYYCYTVYTWNLDAQLTDLYNLHTNDELTAESLFQHYPKLLTYATTNGLNTAQTAFTNGVGRYLAAINFILARPTNVVRLFNYDYSGNAKEPRFRQSLIDLQNSIIAPVTLAANPSLTVSIAPIAQGHTTIRSLLPQLAGNGFVLGSLPDPTFGGVVVAGSTIDSVEARLTRNNRFVGVPHIGTPFVMADQSIDFSVRTIPDKFYDVYSSSDLNFWDYVDTFYSTGSSYDFDDPAAAFSPYLFYQVVQEPSF